MVNPGICRRCPNCKGVHNDRVDGERVSRISVDCSLLDGGTLLISEEVPKDCPYILEHMLLVEHTFDLHEGTEEEFKEQADASEL